MISLEIARRLKSVGLEWIPKVNDFFAIPDRGLDEKIFVLCSVMSYLSEYHGESVVTFHGSVEWALDYIATIETVWLPTEEQLRDLLEDRTNRSMDNENGPPIIALYRDQDGYECRIQSEKSIQKFRGSEASEAYALALIHNLESCLD